MQAHTSMRKYCTAGLGIWEWASNDKGGEPDIVMVCCGDVPTLETLAAVDLDRVPQLGTRAAYAKLAIRDILIEHKQYIHEHGEDMPMIDGWRWGQLSSVPGQANSTAGDTL